MFSTLVNFSISINSSYGFAFGSRFDCVPVCHRWGKRLTMNEKIRATSSHQLLMNPMLIRRTVSKNKNYDQLNWMKSPSPKRMYGNGGHRKHSIPNCVQSEAKQSLHCLSPFEWRNDDAENASPVCLSYKRKIWLNNIFFIFVWMCVSVCMCLMSIFDCLLYKVQKKIENPPDERISNMEK